MYSTPQKAPAMIPRMPSGDLSFGFPLGSLSSAPAFVMQDLTGNDFARLHLVPCEERLRTLQRLLDIAEQAHSRRHLHCVKFMPDSTQVAPQSPCERRHQERFQARAKLAVAKERKAQFAMSNSPQNQTGKQARRISSFTETTPSHKPNGADFAEDDNSTICMPVSFSSPHEQETLDCVDIDDIFDDESGYDDEDSFEEPREQSLPLQSFPHTIVPTAPVSPELTRQVSEASLGRFLRSPREDTRRRNPTPKELGISSWDDVSSVATLSRIGSFEPEPLPMGLCPIPLIIYVPTANPVEYDFEPLRVFPSPIIPNHSNQQYVAASTNPNFSFQF